MLVLATGCGRGAEDLANPTQVERAFNQQGLQTEIVFDCFAPDNVLTTCALPQAQGVPHVFGMIVSRHGSSETDPAYPVQAWMLDSSRATRGFNRVDNVYSMTGKHARSPVVRLQWHNVVVLVSRRGDFQQRVEAALAALR
jgi:hypothetical protein